MAKKKAKKRHVEERSGYSWRFAGTVMLGIGSLVACGWGFGVVHTRAGDLLALDGVRAEIEWPTQGDGESWLGPSIQAHITEAVELHLAGGPIDAGTLARVGTFLESSGWFEGAPTVRRTQDDLVSITGTWRTPAAVIRSDGRDYVVDWGARPLPLDFALGASGLRAIVGAASSVPLGSDGGLRVDAPWPGDDVLAGLELLRPLLLEGFAGQVAGVDVSGYFSSGRLLIVTDQRTEIVWGGRFSEFVPGEAGSEQKLAILRSNANNAQFGNRIDLGKRRIEIMDERGLMVDLTDTP